MGIDFVFILAHRLDESDILTVPALLSSNSDVSIAVERFKRRMTELYGVRWRPQWPEGNVWLWRGLPGNGGRSLPIGSHFDHADPNFSVLWLGGPASMLGYVGRFTLNLSPILRWHRVWSDAECLAEVRTLVWRLAQALGGDKAIYVPDSSTPSSMALDYVDAKTTLDEIELWLLKNAGAPMPLGQPSKDDIVSYIWSVDDFRDFVAK